MHKPLLLVSVFALTAACAMSAPIVRAGDPQPTGGLAAGTATRLVVLMRHREKLLLDALGKNDQAALKTLLAEDFAQYALGQHMLLTPRADWLRNLASHPFGTVRFANVSAIDHGTALVVNFDLQTVDARNAAQSYGVVDVWTRPQGANDWILSQRYIASSAADATAPGDNPPDVAAPPKRI